MNTYINDKKLSEYPFYETGADAPIPGCISYLGVCLRGTTSSPVYASAITIGMDGVLVSLQIEGSTDGLGTVYATASDGRANMELTGSTVSGTVSMLIDKSSLQNSFGSYKGKFYLDPSCVTYMDDDVAGSLRTVNINGNTYTPAQGLNFTCMGSVIELENGIVGGSTASTALIRGTTAVDTYSLVTTSQYANTYVEAINELTIPADADIPTFELIGESGVNIVVIKGSTESESDLVLDLVGTTAFPNCYKKGDEA